MRYDAVLFDLDGTLTASAPGIYGAVQYALERMGYAPADDEVLRKFVGPPLHDSFRRYLGMDADAAERGVTIYREYYGEHGLLDCSVFPCIPNLLRSLHEEGVYIALATNKPTHLARRVLGHFGLTRFFDAIIGAPLDRQHGDKSDIIRAALPPRAKKVAMVGDRRYDMEAAKACGVDAIGAGWGYGSAEELGEAGADAVCETVEDAARLLCGVDAPPQKGFFITIEGLDGSGKTTQMHAVAAHIASRGYDVLLTREPGGTPISEDIRRLVLDPEKTMSATAEALLYAAARAEHVRKLIRPAIQRGSVVLCDRFVDSSIAYQGGGRELGIETVMGINAAAVDGMLPDLTLLFVVDAERALLRRSAATTLDRLERAGEAFFHRVYDAYARIAEMSGERVRCIDASRDIETVAKESCLHIDRLLASR